MGERASCPLPRAGRTSVELIPSIDLIGGQVVRLRRGRFDDVVYYSRNPLELAKAWASLGARSLHVVDLDGARSGQRENADYDQHASHEQIRRWRFKSAAAFATSESSSRPYSQAAPIAP